MDRLRARSRGQITPLALFALVILLGTVSLVVDGGMFLVTQRQLQAAADSASLAAVWYYPVCDSNTYSTQCGPAASPPPGCPTPPDSASNCVANTVARAQLVSIGALCQAPTIDTGIFKNYPGAGLNGYRVTLECDAPYWFARIMPGIPANMHITANAVATIGTGTLTSIVTPVPAPTVDPTPIGSRLLPVPTPSP